MGARAAPAWPRYGVRTFARSRTARPPSSSKPGQRLAALAQTRGSRRSVRTFAGDTPLNRPQLFFEARPRRSCRPSLAREARYVLRTFATSRTTRPLLLGGSARGPVWLAGLATASAPSRRLAQPVRLLLQSSPAPVRLQPRGAHDGVPSFATSRATRPPSSSVLACASAAPTPGSSRRRPLLRDVSRNLSAFFFSPRLRQCGSNPGAHDGVRSFATSRATCPPSSSVLARASAAPTPGLTTASAATSRSARPPFLKASPRRFGPAPAQARRPHGHDRAFLAPFTCPATHPAAVPP
jgi:hypothetical protein